MTGACRVCGRRDEAAPRPVPFCGDQERWEAAWARADRRWARAQAGVSRFGAVGRDAVEDALSQLRQVHERTDFGWGRWEMADGQAVPLEVGVLAPAGGLRRWVARSVWGRWPRRVWACWLAGGLPVAAVVVLVLLAACDGGGGCAAGRGRGDRAGDCGRSRRLRPSGSAAAPDQRPGAAGARRDWHGEG